MKIALDIDDTITKYPLFFSQLSHKHDVIIVTSRSNIQESIEATTILLGNLDVKFSAIYFCDWSGDVYFDLPDELEGPELLLYQKVIACRTEQVDALFDDDPTVQTLIKKHLPQVSLFSPV